MQKYARNSHYRHVEKDARCPLGVLATTGFTTALWAPSEHELEDASLKTEECMLNTLSFFRR